MTAPPASILSLIGNTPLVPLERISKGLPAPLLAKCEFANPGLSVKDRISLFIVEHAEREGLLRPGGTVIEGTAGNTGIGLALVCAVKRYRCILAIPGTMAKEKIDMVRAFGAELHLTEKKPWTDPGHYSNVAARMAQDIPGALFVNQFQNHLNRRCHYETTGPELWRQTNGRIQVLFSGMGTGGTLAGAGRYLKEQNPAVRVVALDPGGSVYYNWFHHGEARAEGSSIIEGVGIGRVPGNYDGEILDDVVRVDDPSAVRMTHQLSREEGIMAGGCAGMVVHGAIQWLRSHPEVRCGVAILTDSGRNYLSRLENEDWLRSQNLPVD